MKRACRTRSTEIMSDPSPLILSPEITPACTAPPSRLKVTSRINDNVPFFPIRPSEFPETRALLLSHLKARALRRDSHGARPIQVGSFRNRAHNNLVHASNSSRSDVSVTDKTGIADFRALLSTAWGSRFYPPGGTHKSPQTSRHPEPSRSGRRDGVSRNARRPGEDDSSANRGRNSRDARQARSHGGA